MYTLDIIKYVSIRRCNILRIFTMPVSVEEMSPLVKYKFLISDLEHEKDFLKYGCEGVHICKIHTVFEDSYPGKFWVHRLTDTEGSKQVLTIASDQPMKYKNDYFNSLNSDKRFREMEI